MCIKFKAHKPRGLLFKTAPAPNSTGYAAEIGPTAADQLAAVTSQDFSIPI